jgi:hypothetical protein
MRRELPPLSIEQVVEQYPAYRQTLLSNMDNCALSVRFDLEAIDITNAVQARGIIFHRFAAEYLRTLQRTGEVSMPHEEVMQILNEAARQRDVPDRDLVFVPARERRLLRIAALRLGAMHLNMARLIAVEDRIETTLEYDHPKHGKVKRQISGTPDAILADPPNGAVILDWKTAPSAPAAQKSDEHGKHVQSHWSGDHEHVSYGGYFQQRFYALLVLDNYPTAQRATLREYYPIPAESRNATVPRDALEHIRTEMTLLVEMLDRALEGGSESEVWKPSPGKHCGYCSRPASCPIEREARAIEGGIASDAHAARIAAEVAVADVVRGEGLKALKSYHEETGRPIPVKDAKGRREWRWGTDSSGKRRFKQHTPEPPDRAADKPLDDAFGDVEQRRKAAAA